MAKQARFLLAAVIASSIFIPINTSANTVPPSPTAHFYGDANGDTIISLTDLVEHRNFILTGSGNYDTLQPAASKSDTCDVNSTNSCTLGDLTILQNVLLLKSVLISDDPWVITNPVVGGLPASVNALTTVPFRVSLASTKLGLLMGRPGISVTAVVVNGGGTLSGRSCSPVEGVRDQLVTRQTCAVAVTTTDWSTDPALGLTESGETGFSFRAPLSGDSRINFTVWSDANLDRPLVMASVIVSTIPGEGFELTCQPVVNEDAPFQCYIDSVGAAPCSLGAGTTCLGATINDCSTVSVPPQGEASGPGGCSVEVVKDVQTESLTVAINEINANPTITSTCPTSASENVPYVCDLTAVDPDIPAQVISWSKGLLDTCGGSIAGPSYSFTPSSTQGGSSCTLSVIATDDFSPAGTASQNTSVSIIDTNENPVILTASCPSSISEGQFYSCQIDANDYNVPSQTLTWSLAPSDTCGGSITVYNYGRIGIYYWTPSELHGGTTCVMGVRVSDNWSPPGSVTRDYVTSVITEMNQSPTISATCSGGFTSTSGTCAPIVSDPDIPAQTLTCSLGAATTCAGVSVASDCSGTTVPPQASMPYCVVAITVTDNHSSPLSATASATYPILDYPMPYFTALPADQSLFYPRVNGIALDNNLPNSAPGDPGYLTCSLVSTDCGFPVDYTGTGAGVVWCLLTTTEPAGSGSCNATLRVTDGSGLYLEESIVLSWLPDSWTWVAGDNSNESIRVYGIKGVVDSANSPGWRYGAVSWTDASGNFWMFGGSNYVWWNETSGFLFNDLWKWDGSYWTWMGGSSAPNQLGVYGTQGVSAPSNVPGARYGALSWTDNITGYMWLFGGVGYAASGYRNYLNDLWRWDGANWTWISGSNMGYESGSYGTKGVPAPTNHPGARSHTTGWIDSFGNLWLFGGHGVDFTTNDLWRWDGANWTWMSGSTYYGGYGVYGTKGVPAPSNVPGSRYRAVSWTDSSGDFWLFGGANAPQASYYWCGYPYEEYNDLWRWDGVNWTWISGSIYPNESGSYGQRGVPSASNVPGSRIGGVTWTDSSNNKWLFGGANEDCYFWDDGYGGGGQEYSLLSKNDLWKWDGNYWTWIGGSYGYYTSPVFGTKLIAGVNNQPPARIDTISWTNDNDKLWLFIENDLWMYNP